VPLRIAFDLDGVLADMESALIREAVGLFGEKTARRLRAHAVEIPAISLKVPEGNGVSAPAAGTESAVADEVPPFLKVTMSERQQSRLWRHVATVDNFWEGLAECEPGVIARLAAIAEERRWEVIFLTKRPETAGALAQVQTQRWLVSKGFRLPSVFVVQRSRGRIAAALELDVVVDDRPENCLDVVVDSKARAILVWRPDPKTLPAATRRLGIGVVSSVNQCLDILTDLDKASDQPGVIDRVMRLLGLKEAVNA
jgi:phosphoglycolate phosphatase-like HAD superfamily hydrolase